MFFTVSAGSVMASDSQEEPDKERRTPLFRNMPRQPLISSLHFSLNSLSVRVPHNLSSEYLSARPKIRGPNDFLVFIGFGGFIGFIWFYWLYWFYWFCCFFWFSWFSWFSCRRPAPSHIRVELRQPWTHFLDSKWHPIDVLLGSVQG